MTPSEIAKELRENGLCQVDGLLPMSLIDSLRSESLAAVNLEIERQGTMEFNDLGRVLFAPMYGGAFLELLEQKPLFNILREFMGGNIIMYTMTTSCIPPGRSNYTNRIHRDTHIIIPDFPPIVAMQVLLDDFTEENGAPLFMKGSQVEPEEPDSKRFEAKADRITGKKGAINFFDPRVWHRSAENHTDKWRCCLLPGFIHPWMKQRFNVEAMLENTDLSGCSDHALQLLGLKNLPPKSWDEFYAKGSSVFS
jgi:ectoine hydroxylase-related dioxygenase (phytanoyl-CoA dioxygenase family)